MPNRATPSTEAARGPPFTRRRFIHAAGGVAFAAAAGAYPLGPARAAQELNVLVWCDHADTTLLRPFAEAFGARVNVTEHDGAGSAHAILERSRPGDWDVLVVDSVRVPPLAAAGRLAGLDEAELPWDDIFSGVRQPELHDLGGTPYAVPEKFGFNGVAFNAERVAAADIGRLSALWDPRYAGRIAVYDDHIAVIGLVGLALGVAPAALTVERLSAVGARLFELKRLAALVGDAAAVQNALVAGTVDIVAGGGEFLVAALKADNPALDWLVPEEGSIRWGQAIAVLAGSDRQALATEFVKYVLSPEGQALLATSACYWGVPANGAAVLGPEQKQALRWDDQPEYIANSHNPIVPDAELDAAMRKVWAAFRDA